MNTTTQIRTPKLWLSLSILVLSFAVLYHHVLAKLVHDWIIDQNYSHGFLIPPIAAFLVWQARDRLTKASIKPANSGLIVVVAGLLLFLAATLASELFSSRFSMIPVIWGTLVFLLGYEVGRILFLPVAYLIFMVPLPAILWNKIAFPLKLFATRMAVNAINLLTIPAFREGNIIHLSNTTLQVVDACSGMRSLTSLLALSAAFAILTSHPRKWKWALFFSAIPIAICLNIFRLIVTAATAQYIGPEAAQGFLHEFSGILVFLLAIAILYGFHLLLQRFITVEIAHTRFSNER